jgi:hypothetical protein
MEVGILLNIFIWFAKKAAVAARPAAADFKIGFA